MNKIFNYQSKKAFTIAEMLMVTIIMGILFTIGGRVYFDERSRFQVNEAFNQFIGMIKTARSSATTSQPVFSLDDNTTVVPENGYGVYINLNPAANEPHFTLFASMGDDDADPNTFNTGFDKGLPATYKDVVLETYRLPDQVGFQFLSFDDGAGYQEKWYLQNQIPVLDASEAVILFRPPLAEVYLSDNQTPPQYLEQLKMRFFNPLLPEGSTRRCTYVEINRLKGFPVIDYTDCKESAYPI